jgi:hypothetical protein
MTWLESIIEDYEFEQRVNRTIWNDLAVNFQITPELITDEIILKVDNDCYNKMKYWIPEKFKCYEEIYLRKLVEVLKDPHYYLYKNKQAIWSL